MAKFTKKQVEKILTAHSLGMMKRGGETWDNPSCSEDPKCCIMQVVKEIPDRIAAYDSNKDAAHWFDLEYQPDWTPEQFVDALRAASFI